MRRLERTAAMIANQDRTRLAEDLARIMEELGDPGLTLGRASVLRPQVARLLESIRESDDGPALAPCPGPARSH